MGKGNIDHIIDEIIAGKDAEIAQLRKRVAEADQIVRAGEAERKALAAQVAELQAWRDAVPVDAIAFLVGATEDSLGISWQTRYVAEWANKMPK